MKLPLLGLFFLACPRTSAPPPAPAPTGATLVQVVSKDPPTSAPAATRKPTEWDRMAVAIDAAQPQALACYEAALGRDPLAYGEVVVDVNVDASGRAPDATVALETVGDDALITCIEGLVRNVRFPTPSQPGVRGRYPFVFTSDRTPPEVVRTLQERYGLLPQEPVENPKKSVVPSLEPGTVETW